MSAPAKPYEATLEMALYCKCDVREAGRILESFGNQLTLIANSAPDTKSVMERAKSRLEACAAELKGLRLGGHS